MNLKELAELLVNLVLLPSIPIIVVYLMNALKTWVKSKTVDIEDSVFNNYLNDIMDIIVQAVSYTTQIYVDALKKQGKFDEEAQKVAFKMTKDAVTVLLGRDLKNFIANMYGDVDLWLDTKIEQVVKELK